MSIFFNSNISSHVKNVFGSELGKVLFYLLLYCHRPLAFGLLKRKIAFLLESLCVLPIFLFGKIQELLWLVLQEKCGFDKLVPMILTYVWYIVVRVLWMLIIFCANSPDLSLYVSRKLWTLLPKLFNFLSVWMLFFCVLIKV